MTRNERLLKLLSFLRSYESSGESLELMDLASYTGYALSTIETYCGRKLRNYLVRQKTDGTYISQGVEELTDEDFLKYMTQRSERVVPPSPSERFRLSLVDRSQQAFILALEIYNRPSLLNRV